MDLDTLIQQAEKLKSVPYDSPKILLWKKRAKKFILASYESEYKQILDRALSFRQIAMSEAHAQQMHVNAMGKAIEFLDSLKEEPVLDKNIKVTEENQGDFSLEKLHLAIHKKCKSLFENEDYSEAVEKGFKVVRDRLRKLTSYETGSEAFGKGKLHIKGAAAPHVDTDFNQGVKFLLMAVDMFRNEKSHTSDGNIDNPQRAYEYLSLCSLAMHLLDNAEIAS